MFYSSIFWYAGVENVHQELRKKTGNVLLVTAVAAKNKICCQTKRQISNWEQLLKINERPVIFTIIADKKKTFCAVFWEGFAKELTAEPTWAKYSKRWSSSGQVPPLVPIAKVKLNLLSAPLKLVSRDSELSLSHPSPQQGPKGDPLKEWGSEQFASTFKPSRPNNPIVTLSISLYHNWHTNVMQNATDWQLQCSSKERRN